MGKKGILVLWAGVCGIWENEEENMLRTRNTLAI